MADTKHLIGQGIGFSPGSVKWVVTDGLSVGAAVPSFAIAPGILGMTGWPFGYSPLVVVAAPVTRAGRVSLADSGGTRVTLDSSMTSVEPRELGAYSDGFDDGYQKRRSWGGRTTVEVE